MKKTLARSGLQIMRQKDKMIVGRCF